MSNFEQGDLVWVDFDMPKGHVQGGRRPALIISKNLYMQRSGMAIVCPITSKIKGYPCEVPVVGKIKGVVLSDHIQTIDIVAHNITFIESADLFTTRTVLENIANLFF